MDGIVGKLKVQYTVNNSDEIIETIDAQHTEKFCLKAANNCVVVIDEIQYIEDTVYNIDLHFECDSECDYSVGGNEPILFEIPTYGIRGMFSLSFI